MKMMAIALALLLSTVAHAQQHAPTREQCDADANLWNVEQPQLKILTGREVWERSNEMNDCAFAYFVLDDQRRMSRYDQLADVYMFEWSGRMMSFLNRHPQIKEQFLKEDAAGQR
jgi:hypothetical protein